jgi:hypothetical protein
MRLTIWLSTARQVTASASLPFFDSPDSPSIRIGLRIDKAFSSKELTLKFTDSQRKVAPP